MDVIIQTYEGIDVDVRHESPAFLLKVEEAHLLHLDVVQLDRAPESSISDREDTSVLAQPSRCLEQGCEIQRRADTAVQHEG